MKIEKHTFAWDEKTRFDQYVQAALTGLSTRPDMEWTEAGAGLAGTFAVRIARAAIAEVDGADKPSTKNPSDNIGLPPVEGANSGTPEPAPAEFKVGDRVKILHKGAYQAPATIASKRPHDCYRVLIDGDKHGESAYHYSNLEHLPTHDVNAQLLEAAEKYLWHVEYSTITHKGTHYRGCPACKCHNILTAAIAAAKGGEG